MTFKKIIVLAILAFIFPLSTSAQLNHEFSLTLGLYQLRGDYGQRGNSENNFANQGISIGANYYYNTSFSRNAGYFQEHFKPKFNFTFTTVNLEHVGYDGDPRLDAMTGSSTNFRFGVGLEWFPRELDFEKNKAYSTFHPKNIHPYAGFNVGLNFSMPDAESSLPGGLENPDNIFPTFIAADGRTGINLENSTNWYFSFQGGIRFKIKDNKDLLLESNWVFFDSDFIDGLSPVGEQNESNDWSWGINIGYSYTFF